MNFQRRATDTVSCEAQLVRPSQLWAASSNWANVHMTTPYKLPDALFDEWLQIQGEIHRGGSYRGRYDIYAQLDERLAEELARTARWTGEIYTTRSGMEALEFSLRTAGAGPGASVAAPVFAYHAVGAAIHAVGATPLWCDVDGESWQLTPQNLEDAGAGDVNVVLAVDNFGQPCPVDELAAWCRAHNATFVLDACESFGAVRLHESSAPDAVALSFSFTKPVHAFGAGGAVFIPGTASQPSAEDLAYIERRRLPSANASYLLLALPDLDASVKRLNTIHATYRQWLESSDFQAQHVSIEGVRLHAPFLLETADRRNQVLAKLASLGIESKLQWPLQTLLFGHVAPSPVSADLSARVVSLPSGPGMPQEALDLVIAELVN